MPAKRPARKPRLGQHFLARDDIANDIVAAAGIRPGERVLEIGPGEGVLTRRLTAAGAKLTAIELDRSLADQVRVLWPDAAVVEGDAAMTPWPAFDVMVSNLPFQISSPVLFRLLASTGWRRAVIMVQREFGDRMLAAPDSPEYGRLTVKTALHAECTRLRRVPRGAFRPPPEVEAVVLVLTPRPPPAPIRDEALLDALVDHVFTQRRKTLRRSLAAFKPPAGTDGDVDAALARTGYGDRRPGELTPAQFVALANAHF